MTRDEEIVNASNELFNSVRCGKSYKLGFSVGIKWADEHHRWRSVEEELPKQDEEVIVLCDDLKNKKLDFQVKYIPMWNTKPKIPMNIKCVGQNM